MMSCVRHLDVNRTEESKYHCLDVADKEFKSHHEDAHEYADRSDYSSEEIAHEASESEHDEDHTCKRDGDSVTCKHVCEESDAEHDRLDEHAEELDEWHQWHRALQPCWHLWPEYFHPIVLVACDVGNEECAESKEARNSNVTCDVTAAWREWHYTHEVGEEDEEEAGEQVWSVFVCLLAEG